jgi:hypothetical protein
MPALNQRDAIHYISERKEFTASALSGAFKRYTPETGRLNATETAKLIEDSQGIGGLYVVYSYGTPIAWHSLDGWYVVEQKFSVTTSKHQNYVRRAIAESLQGVN